MQTQLTNTKVDWDFIKRNCTKPQVERLEEAYVLGIRIDEITPSYNLNPLIDLIKKGYNVNPYLNLTKMHYPSDIVPLVWGLLEECLEEGLDTYIFTRAFPTLVTVNSLRFIVNELRKGVNYTHEPELFMTKKCLNVENYYAARNLGIEPQHAALLYRGLPISRFEEVKKAQDFLGATTVYELLCKRDGYLQFAKEKDPLFTLLKTLVKYNIKIEKFPTHFTYKEPCVRFFNKGLVLTNGRVIPKTSMSYVDLLYDKYGEPFKDFIRWLNKNYRLFWDYNAKSIGFIYLAIYEALQVLGKEFKYKDVATLGTFIKTNFVGLKPTDYKCILNFIALGEDLIFYRNLLNDDVMGFVKTLVNNPTNKKKYAKTLYFNKYFYSDYKSVIEYTDRAIMEFCTLHDL
jgi:hypothetical protein